MQVPALDWLLHEGYSIFWSAFHDEKMMNVANATMSACGRLLPVVLMKFKQFQRPLLRKAVIEVQSLMTRFLNVCFAQ